MRPVPAMPGLELRYAGRSVDWLGSFKVALADPRVRPLWPRGAHEGKVTRSGNASETSQALVNTMRILLEQISAKDASTPFYLRVRS